MTEIEFTVYGKPRGKQRPRFTKGGIVYTPKETVDYERHIKAAALEACRAWERKAKRNIELPTKEPVKVSIVAYMKNTTLKKPDIDNIVKIILDGLNGTIYADDRQVVYITAIKCTVGSGSTERVEVKAVFLDTEGSV